MRNEPGPGTPPTHVPMRSRYVCPATALNDTELCTPHASSLHPRMPPASGHGEHPAYTAIFVSMVLIPHVLTDTGCVAVAVQQYQRSKAISKSPAYCSHALFPMPSLVALVAS